MKKAIFYEHIVGAAKQNGVSVEEMIRYAGSLGYVGVDVEWKSAEALDEAYQMLRVANVSVAVVYRSCEVGNGYDRSELGAFFECLLRCECQSAMMIFRAMKESDRESVASDISGICELAQEYGITVTSENFDGSTGVMGDMDMVGYFLDAVPKLSFTLDTGNFAFFGENAVDACKRFLKRISHVHLKDRAAAPIFEGEKGTKSADGTVFYPSPIGAGYIPVEACIEILMERGYDGYVTVEHFGAKDLKRYMAESARFVDQVLNK